MCFVEECICPGYKPEHAINVCMFTQTYIKKEHGHQTKINITPNGYWSFEDVFNSLGS